MRDWWLTFLEARIVYEGNFEGRSLVFITYDDEHHRLAIFSLDSPSAVDGEAAGLDHVAFTFEGLTELSGHYTRLRDQGVLPYWSIHHGPTISLYYRDPDGNQ